jgi:hypothetical protein
VLELGFGERAQQRAALVAGGEVQEGAGDDLLDAFTEAAKLGYASRATA